MTNQLEESKEYIESLYLDNVLISLLLYQLWLVWGFKSHSSYSIKIIKRFTSYSFAHCWSHRSLSSQTKSLHLKMVCTTIHATLVISTEVSLQLNFDESLSSKNILTIGQVLQLLYFTYSQHLSLDFYITTIIPTFHQNIFFCFFSFYVLRDVETVWFSEYSLWLLSSSFFQLLNIIL